MILTDELFYLLCSLLVLVHNTPLPPSSSTSLRPLIIFLCRRKGGRPQHLPQPAGLCPAHLGGGQETHQLLAGLMSRLSSVGGLSLGSGARQLASLMPTWQPSLESWGGEGEKDRNFT